MGIPQLRFGPPKLVESRGIKGFSPRIPLSRKLGKPQNWTPLLRDLGGESQEKEPQRVHAYTPHQIPKRNVSKPPQENRQEKAPKITKKEKQERHNQVLRNHAKSSIHIMKDHTRSSLPPIIHPSLKISP
jgi:hypothetical protein